jgi:hypothetical protein
LIAFGLKAEESYPMLSPFLPLPSPDASPEEAESAAGSAQAAANKALYNMLAVALRVLTDCEVRLTLRSSVTRHSAPVATDSLTQFPPPM